MLARAAVVVKNAIADLRLRRPRNLAVQDLRTQQGVLPLAVGAVKSPRAVDEAVVKRGDGKCTHFAYQPTRFVLGSEDQGRLKRRRSNVTRFARSELSSFNLRKLRNIDCAPGLLGSPSPRKVCARSSSASSISMPDNCFSKYR